VKTGFNGDAARIFLAIGYNPRNKSNRALRQRKMTHLKFIIVQHSDGFLAYPLGMHGVVVGEGDTYDEALADAKSAAKFHIETFGADAFPSDSPLVDAFIVDAGVDA
jgi:predicted RNase H-like HicB family nuclease